MRREDSIQRQRVPEDTLASREIQIERKRFIALLKENPRGRFLRISEDGNGRINSIIIPTAGLQEFQKLLGEMLAAAEALPEQPAPEAPQP